MLEFLTMLSIAAMIFCVGTVFSALFIGGILRASRNLKKKVTQEIS